MADVTDNGDDGSVIERTTTGMRMLYTLFFAFVGGLVQVVLAYVVLYELFYTLVVERRPSPRVARFAHLLVRYGYDIGQYVTYNKDGLPFPFGDFPHDTESPDTRAAATG